MNCFCLSKGFFFLNFFLFDTNRTKLRIAAQWKDIVNKQIHFKVKIVLFSTSTVSIGKKKKLEITKKHNGMNGPYV